MGTLILMVAAWLNLARDPLLALLDDGRPRSQLETAAIKRQIFDLETAKDRGLVWDVAEADRAVECFSALHHWEGELAREPFVPEAWQEHCLIRPILGWYRMAPRSRGGVRRFRTVWIELPRGNGKTFLAAGFAIFGAVGDYEEGAGVFCAATMKDQAALLLRDCKEIVLRSPELATRVTLFADSVYCEHWSSKITTLPSDAKTLDGLKVHFAIIDEVHAHKNREVWDVVEGGKVKKKQPLQIGITTAGPDRGLPDSPTIAWEQHCYAELVLKGYADASFVDDAYFAFIACAEDGDDQFAEETWRKANPNFGVSINPLEFADLFRQARTSPAKLANVSRKHLNLWIGAQQRAINVDEWKACEGPCENVDGMQLFTAIDIGLRNDMAARVHLFVELETLEAMIDNSAERDECDDAEEPRSEVSGPRTRIKRAVCLTRFWLPEYGRRDMSREPYLTWRKNGHLVITQGNSTDIGDIFRSVIEDDKRLDIRQVAFDPHNARQMGQDFIEYGISAGKSADDPTKGFAFDFWQTPRNYNEPCNELTALIADRRIEHDGNPIMSWMIGNMVYRTDSKGYMMPDKGKSAEKIDGPVALLMALGRAMFAPPPVTVGAFTLE